MLFPFILQLDLKNSSLILFNYIMNDNAEKRYIKGDKSFLGQDRVKGLERNGVSLLFKIIPQKIKNSYYMIQSLHCWVCNRRKWNHCLGERPAPPRPQPKCPSTDEWMKVWHKHRNTAHP